MEKKSKETRINEELDRISFYFELADGNQRAIVKPLLQNAAFMKITLDDLQEIINKEGVTEVYQNGANQHGIKQSAAVQSYNSTIKNYASVIKTLAGLLPPEKRKTVPVWTPPKEKTPEELAEDIKEMEEENHRANERLGAALWHWKRTGERIDMYDISEDDLIAYREARAANGGKPIVDDVF